jgi:hypothetical protein
MKRLKPLQQLNSWADNPIWRDIKNPIYKQVSKTDPWVQYDNTLNARHTTMRFMIILNSLNQKS